MALSIGSIATTFVAKTAPFESGVKRASASVKRMGSDVQSVGMKASAAFKRFGDSVIAKAAKIGAALAGIGFVKMAISSAAEMQQDIITIKAFLGSLEKANALMAQLREFAKTTPFQLKDIVAATKQLLAFGFALEDINNTLFVLGNLAAMSGASLQELAQIFGKIKSMGHLTGETLNQLAERGIPVIRALAEYFGVAESAIRDMVSAGLISFNDMMAAMTNMAGAGGQFGNLMAEQAETLAGLWSTFKDNVISLALAFGEKLIPVIVKLLKVGLLVITWLNNLNRSTIKNVLIAGAMIKTLGYMITIIPKLMKAIRALVVTLGILTAAELAANAAGQNFAGVAVAMGLIITTGVATAMAFDQLDASIAAAGEEVDGLVSSTDTLQQAAEGASAIEDIANQNTDAIKTETEAVEDLNAELDKTNRKPISVAVRGSAAEFSARQRSADATERHQKAQLKAQQQANNHLNAIEENTNQPLAAAGI
jgi:tape measure domain-containing protein